MTSVVRLLVLAISGLVCVLVLSACDSGKPQTTAVRSSQSDGGTITLGDDVTLRIPAGALSDDTTVTVSRASADEVLSELEGGAPVGDGFSIDLGGRELLKPVTLEIAYEPGRLSEEGSEDVVFLAYYNEAAEEWIPVGGRADRDRDAVIIETDHLSWWQPWEWDWDAWIAVLKKTLSLKLSNWIDAVKLLTGECHEAGEHASADSSKGNRVIQGCIDKDDPSSPEFRVVNLKSFFLGISPAPDGPGYPPSSLLGPGDAARFTASNTDAPPAIVYADFTEAAMWRFIVGLAARMLPLGDEIPNEGLGFIAEGLQKVMSAEEVSEALESGDAAAAAEAVIELVTSDIFIEKFTELAAEYGEKNGLDMMKKWTKAGIKQVFLAVAAADVIFSSTDFVANYFFNNRSEVAFNWATPTPTPTPTPAPTPTPTPAPPPPPSNLPFNLQDYAGLIDNLQLAVDNEDGSLLRQVIQSRYGEAEIWIGSWGGCGAGVRAVPLVQENVDAILQGPHIKLVAIGKADSCDGANPAYGVISTGWKGKAVPVTFVPGPTEAGAWVFTEDTVLLVFWTQSGAPSSPAFFGLNPHGSPGAFAKVAELP